MAQAQATIIEPDVSFVRQIIENGGDTLKKCYQCGNCSAVCNITPDNVPFPRKEMIWAQWGLKDRLIGNADVWLCHQCNDCSAHCPRGANPGDVMAAIRNISFAHFSPFGIGALFTSKKYLPLLLLLPMALIGIAVAIASKEGFMSMTPIVFSNMMPVPAIDAVFLPTVGLAALAALIGITNITKSFKIGTPGVSAKTGAMIPAAVQTAIGILKHEKMGQCEANGPRTIAHKMLFYGFFALLATTTLVGVMYWINKLEVDVVAATPLDLTHPVKLLGNIGALLAFIGVSIIYKRRLTGDTKIVGKTGYYDSFFGAVLFWTVTTGILSQIFRLMEIASVAFGVYYVHLVFVFALLVYAPYSKFSHMFYRFMALTYSNAAQRAKEQVE